MQQNRLYEKIRIRKCNVGIYCMPTYFELSINESVWRNGSTMDQIYKNICAVGPTLRQRLQSKSSQYSDQCNFFMYSMGPTLVQLCFAIANPYPIPRYTTVNTVIRPNKINITRALRTVKEKNVRTQYMYINIRNMDCMLSSIAKNNHRNS